MIRQINKGRSVQMSVYCCVWCKRWHIHGRKRTAADIPKELQVWDGKPTSLSRSEQDALLARVGKFFALAPGQAVNAATAAAFNEMRQVYDGRLLCYEMPVLAMELATIRRDDKTGKIDHPIRDARSSLIDECLFRMPDCGWQSRNQ
jgi:hypothetical protein